MAKITQYIIIFGLLGSIGFGQLRSDLPHKNAIPPNNAESNSSIMSLFDPSRFSMNHSFSVGMMNMSNQSMSVASYTNNMNFLLHNNLYLQTNVTFMQPKMLSVGTPNPYLNTNSQIYYDAVLDYTPTDNTHFQISVGNYPIYNQRQLSPFGLYRGY